MAFPQGFSARTVQPQGNSQQLPVSPVEGWTVIITNSEMKYANGSTTNGYMELTLQITEGEHAGQKGFYRLNLYHENGKTVEIANKQLSALCWVCANPDAVDEHQLFNIPFKAVVGLQKKKTADDPDYTQVTGVKHLDGADPGKSSGVSSTTQLAPPTPPVQQAPVQQFAPTQQQAPAPTQQQAAPPQQWGAPQQQVPVQQQATPPAWSQPVQQQTQAAAPPWGAK
jgi:hypothetical protein